jgi:hypothetical protein
MIIGAGMDTVNVPQLPLDFFGQFSETNPPFRCFIELPDAVVGHLVLRLSRVDVCRAKKKHRIFVSKRQWEGAPPRLHCCAANGDAAPIVAAGFV